MDGWTACFQALVKTPLLRCLFFEESWLVCSLERVEALVGALAVLLNSTLLLGHPQHDRASRRRGGRVNWEGSVPWDSVASMYFVDEALYSRINASGCKAHGSVWKDVGWPVNRKS